jgi:NADH-quinone oxidoreductase subunit A
MESPTTIAAYLVLFLSVGAVFLLANLVIGWLVRPDDPHEEKKEIYECGEPAIGSSFVQFDLRFYVVALVFIVFDAEVAFLFPAATVFGKQAQLADRRVELVAAAGDATGAPVVTPAAADLFRELGVEAPALGDGGQPADASAKASAITPAASQQELRQAIDDFTLYVYAATLFFFFVLFIGFAYEWKTGAFDWVRAVTRPRGSPVPMEVPLSVVTEEQPVLSR